MEQLKILLHWHIGTLDETCLKHKTAILFIAAIMFFVDPEVTITFSSASLAGLGITVDPPQTIPVGFLLLALLAYRIIALWMTAILNSGTDLKRTTERLSLHYDPSYLEPSTVTELITHDAGNSVYQWEGRKILWDFLLPNIVALACLAKYASHYLPDTIL